MSLETASQHNPSHTSNTEQNGVFSVNWKSIICHIIPLMLTQFTFAVVDSSLLLLIPLYAHQAFPSHSSTMAGLILTCQGIGLVATSPFIGDFIASTTTEFCLLSATLVRTLCILLIFIWHNSLFVWISTSLLYGLSATATRVCVNHFMSMFFKTRNRGRVSSIINGARRAGSACGPLYVGLISNVQLSLGLTMAISCATILVVCCIMTPPNHPLNLHNTESSMSHGSFIYFKQSFKQIGIHKFHPKYWVFFAPNRTEKQRTRFCYVWKTYGKLLVSVGIFAFALSWVRITRKLILTFHALELHLSHAQIGTINAVSFVPDTLMFPLAGFVSDRYGRKAAGIPGFVMFVVALLLLSFTNNFVELILVGILFGLADGITAGLLMTFCSDIAPMECRSQFISQFRFFSNVPLLVCPTVIGVLCTNVSLMSGALLSASIGAIGLFWIVFVLEESSKVSETIENANELMINERNENKENMVHADDVVQQDSDGVHDYTATDSANMKALV
eukprot:78861_1